MRSDILKDICKLIRNKQFSISATDGTGQEEWASTGASEGTESEMPEVTVHMSSRISTTRGWTDIADPTLGDVFWFEEPTTIYWHSDNYSIPQ